MPARRNEPFTAAAFYVRVRHLPPPYTADVYTPPYLFINEVVLLHSSPVRRVLFEWRYLL